MKSLALAVLLAVGEAAALDYGEVMREIADYQYGDSRYPIVWVEELVQWSVAYPHERVKLADSLAALIGGNASFEAKQFGARQLALIGEARHVPALAPLLCCEETADLARYALERMPAPEIDTALLEMLDETDADIQIGIINTLGARSAKIAVDPLIKAAKTDHRTAAAAIAALGKMTDKHALRALKRVKVAEEQRLNVAHARLAQANALEQTGAYRRANGIYMDLARNPVNKAVARAALLGRYRLADEEARERLLVEYSEEEQAQIRRYVASREQ